ncbi:hypothetical protein FTX61_15090 [Nitriliruptoraceae bacterium ZYF776]|nr:hypothetical protein [Profundirhabdus halotolerans]
MLRLLEGELGEVHLVLEPTLRGHRLHERLDVLGDRLLAGDERGTQVQGCLALVVAELLPVLGVLREVDVAAAPEPVLALHEQPHRQVVPVQSTSSQRPEARAVALGVAVGLAGHHVTSPSSSSPGPIPAGEVHVDTQRSSVNLHGGRGRRPADPSCEPLAGARRSARRRDPVIVEVVLGPAADAFLEVGALVGVTLVAFGLARWRTGDALTRWFDRHRRLGPLAGALLGAFPGCGGAIVVMPLYLRREVSFGTVVATLTATMGDSSFVLLAADPGLAVAVHGGLLVVGLLTGAVVDLVGIDPREPVEPVVPAVAPVATSRSSTVGAAAAATGLLGRPVTGRVDGPLVAFWVLTTAAFLLAVPVVLQLVDPSRLDVWGLPTTTIVGVAGAVACLALTVALRRRGHGHLDDACAPVPERPHDVLVDAARETAQVGTWVVLAFVGYEVLVAATGLDVGRLPTFGLLGVAAGALLGLVPGCGPQLVLTGLYVQGAVPLSVLAANALSQDGDALFPLLAVDKRSAITASAISAVPGLVVGGGLVALGW